MSTRIASARPKRHRDSRDLRKNPVQERARATIDDILAAAAQVFEQHGYAAGTTNRIAKRAGVSIGTLYQYFPNKDAVVVALLERHLQEAKGLLQGWVAIAVSQPRALREVLVMFVEGMIELHSGAPRLQHILLEETPLPPRAHQMLLDMEQEAAATIAAMLQQYPEVRHPEPEHAAFMLVQTAESLTHRFAAHPEHALPREAFAKELVAMMEAYLTRG